MPNILLPEYKNDQKIFAKMLRDLYGTNLAKQVAVFLSPEENTIRIEEHYPQTKLFKLFEEYVEEKKLPDSHLSHDSSGSALVSLEINFFSILKQYAQYGFIVWQNFEIEFDKAALKEFYDYVEQQILADKAQRV